MHTLWLTGRLLSRAIWNGISNISTAADPNLQRKTDPHFISAVCGFPKEKRIERLIKGQFGDDAWFTAKYKAADVLGSSATPFPPMSPRFCRLKLRVVLQGLLTGSADGGPTGLIPASFPCTSCKPANG